MPATPRGQICAGCQQEIKGGRISCTATTCKKIYDLACTQTKDLSKEEIAHWICPECRATRRKTVDLNTPIRAAPPVSLENVTLRKKSTPNTQNLQASSSDDHIDLQDLAREIKAMRSDFSGMKTDIFSRLEDVMTVLHETAYRLDSIEAKQEALERKNSDLEIMVQTLKTAVATMAQDNLRNEVEILGVHENKGENPLTLALATGMKIGVKLEVSDIEDAVRVGSRRVSSGTEDGLPRPLVVRFATKAKRDTFLKEARARSHHLSNKDISEGGLQLQKVFVNERLTPENRKLFREARERARNCNYKYCWVKKGCIYVRKRDGRPALRVHSSRDLHSVIVAQHSETAIA